jgi:hypothetical protein
LKGEREEQLAGKMFSDRLESLPLLASSKEDNDFEEQP